MKKKDLVNLGLNEYKLKKNDIIDIISLKLDISKNELFLLEDINNKYIDNIEFLFKKLKNGYQIEYILKYTNFFSIDFYVDDRVLIPRNDTEILVSEVLKSTLINYDLVDIGTGTSCIPISIAKNNSDKIDKIYVLDISTLALEVSEINIKKNQLDDKIKQLKSDLLSVFFDNNIDISDSVIITANLPYIKDNDFGNMDKGVINNEPSLALYGGKKTGFELYEQLIDQCFLFRKKYDIINLELYIEIGFDQFEYSNNFLSNKGLKFEYFKDNNNINRAIKIYNF